MAIVNPNQLWVQIQNQLPDYIRSDPAYAQLVTFLNAYYVWLQTTGQPIQVIADTQTNLSIDDTVDAFVEYFSHQYLDNFPLLYDPTETDPTIKAHKREQIKRLIKHADQLYISKGTDDSIKMLFRVLYGEEINLFFPKTVLLKPSDGHWYEAITIKISIVSGNINAFDLTYGSALALESVDGTNNTLTGASATIESFQAIHNYYELFITPGTLIGPTKAYSTVSGNQFAFTPGNKVILTLGGSTVIGTIFPVPSLFTINDTVGSHAVGDSIYVGNSLAILDTNILLQVKSVDTTGHIKKINVIDSFSDISSGYTYLYDRFNKVVGTCTIGGLTYYPGVYKTVEGVDLGFLSDQIKLRGPMPVKSLPEGHAAQEYYQEFSYVIQSSVSPQEWLPTVKALLHPLGYQLFGDIQIHPTTTGGFDLLGLYHFNKDTVNDVDVYSAYKYHLVNVLPFSTPNVLQLDSQPSNVLGPSLQSLNKFMMVSPPYVGGNTSYGATIPSSTAAFSGVLVVPAWSSSCIGSTQIKDFANLVVGDFFNGAAPTKRSNIMPQPYVLIE